MQASVTAQAIDDVLAGTFPASDPPSWTPGLARPAPRVVSHATEPGPAQSDSNDVQGVIDVSRPTRPRAFARGLVSLIGAAGLSLLVPVAVLAVGLPVALGVRGVLEVAEWFLVVVR